MTYKIGVSHASCFEDGEMNEASFADYDMEPINFAIFSKLKFPAEQDRSLGMDKIYIEIGDQSRATYGGVTKVEISDDTIFVYFDTAASQKLDIQGPISLDFTITSEEIKNAVDALTSMMRSDNITIFRIPPPA